MDSPLSFYAYPEKGTGSFSEPIFICAHLRPSADNAVVAFSLTSNTVGSNADAPIAETRQTGKTGIP